MEKFKKYFKNKKIIITGHTGFKGSWLTFFLLNSGGKVLGISKDIPNRKKFFKMIDDSSLNIINLFDWGNLRHMIPIFNQCKFFIGSDSGLMHLAASTNCKTFALFGPTNEIVYGPWGDHKVIKSLNYPAIDDPLNLPVEKVLNIIKKEMG